MAASTGHNGRSRTLMITSFGNCAFRCLQLQQRVSVGMQSDRVAFARAAEVKVWTISVHALVTDPMDALSTN